MKHGVDIKSTEWQYSMMAILLAMKALSAFLSPIAINRLLLYLETDSEPQVVRPWVWLVALFAGPAFGSMTWGMYLFITARLIVRTEAVITKLVFDHALKIRFTEQSNTPAKPLSETTSAGHMDDDGSVVGQQKHQATVLVDGEDWVERSEGEVTMADTSAGTSEESSSSKGTREARSPDVASIGLGVEATGQGADLVGKLTNLVSTDLKNITEGHDYRPPQLKSSTKLTPGSHSSKLPHRLLYGTHTSGSRHMVLVQSTWLERLHRLAHHGRHSPHSWCAKHQHARCIGVTLMPMLTIGKVAMLMHHLQIEQMKKVRCDSQFYGCSDSLDYRRRTLAYRP